MATEVTVPVLGELITEATLGEWLKQPGDPVSGRRADRQPRDRQGLGRGALAGRRRDGRACGARSATLSQVGAMIATIEAGERCRRAAAPRPPLAVTEAPARACRDRRPAGAAAIRRRPRRASPSVRRAVLEHGVDPATVKGTGKDGRITKDDVVAAAAAASRRAGARPPRRRAAAAPRSPPSTGRKEERVRMTRLRQTDRQAPQGSAEHRRDAHHVQRRGHDRGDRGARPSTRICSRRSTASGSASWASS